MSINFVIIPITTDFASIADDIQIKLKDNIAVNHTVIIDNNYTSSLSTRTNKWRKKSYNVIVVDYDYNESNSIIVTFSGSRSKAQIMVIDEFIELVSSFENDDVTPDNTVKSCIIM